MTRILATIIITLAGIHTAFAQRIVGELESNTDMVMMPDDSIGLRRDTQNDKNDKTLVPVDVRAWTIDDTYGNRTGAVVDTLLHQIQNSNLNEGRNGYFSHLGNLGSPRISHIFFEREDFGSEFIFLNPFGQFFVPTNKFLFYNTKSPYLNATYNFCGSKTTGDDHVKVVYTNNAGRKVNIGGLFDYMYGQGYYDSQSTAYMGASAWGSYIGDQYDMHFYYTHNYMKLAENGGITDERYITHPEEQDRGYASNDIPTWLSRTWSKQEHDIIHLNHRYNIGYYREEGDSTDLHEVFVPVSSVFHTFDLRYLRRGYLAYNTPLGYHTFDYFPADTTNDKTKNFTMKNVVGLSLREGFNRYAAAGLNAYVSFEHQSFELPDTIHTAFGQEARYVDRMKSTENNISIGGQIIRTQGHTLHYDINAEVGIAGEHIGDLSVSGHGELNIPFLRDTAKVEIEASLTKKEPSFYYMHYHSRHAWWDRELDNETRTRIGGRITFPTTKTILSAGVENIKNYTYFRNTGVANPSSYAIPYSNNVSPAQCPDNIQVVSLNLRQNFKFGILHLDNDITYQACTNQDVIPLPSLNLYHNLYISFTYARVLDIELGADMKYFSSYYAPDYSPVVSQFMLQNPDRREKIGNYPLVSVYANLDLKRTRFYIQYYHANQSDGRYFWLPGYPMNPSGIHMGISWNFYD